ncbi:MAG: hypothetical protein ACRD0O_08690, partial [Acidimicrobiia bacterium]
PNDDVIVGGGDDDECEGYDDVVSSEVEETNRVTCEDVGYEERPAEKSADSQVDGPGAKDE